jgi:uncharacterized delta-60 repeat protein
VFLACLLGLLSSAVQALPLDLDPVYGTQGQSEFSLGVKSGDVGASFLQPDGKLLIAGSRQTGTLTGDYGVQQPNQLFLRRLHGDGSPDTSFGENGEARFSVLGSDSINKIQVQTDGKIVLAITAREPCVWYMIFTCQTPSVSGKPGHEAAQNGAVLRLTAQGKLDPTFNGSGFVTTGYPWDGNKLALQPDGKIVLLGSTSVVRSRIFSWAMRRYNSDGTLDKTFNDGQAVTSSCSTDGADLTLRADGQLITAGRLAIWWGSDPSPLFCLERFNADGRRDTAFGTGSSGWKGIEMSYMRSFAQTADGGFVAIGEKPNCTASDSLCAAVRVVRYGADGTVDRTFGVDGKVDVPIATASNYFSIVDFIFTRNGDMVILLQSWDGSQYTPIWVRISTQGQPVATFGTGGVIEGARSELSQHGFLRDLEDRWLTSSEAKRSNGEWASVVTRYVGEHPETYPVVEFFNTELGHYFVTAGPGEIASIDAGGAGPGWQRTGQQFRTWIDEGGIPLSAPKVCRFYGTPKKGPNSHFYAINGPECEAVKQDAGWTYEGMAFSLYPGLSNGQTPSCPDGLIPVYRAYNNRYATNDSNHRYTVSTPIYQQMLQQGWSAEGVVFCSPAPAPVATVLP